MFVYHCSTFLRRQANMNGKATSIAGRWATMKKEFRRMRFGCWKQRKRHRKTIKIIRNMMKRKKKKKDMSDHEKEKSVWIKVFRKAKAQSCEQRHKKFEVWHTHFRHLIEPRIDLLFWLSRSTIADSASKTLVCAKKNQKHRQSNEIIEFQNIGATCHFFQTNLNVSTKKKWFLFRCSRGLWFRICVQTIDMNLIQTFFLTDRHMAFSHGLSWAQLSKHCANNIWIVLELLIKLPVIKRQRTVKWETYDFIGPWKVGEPSWFALRSNKANETQTIGWPEARLKWKQMWTIQKKRKNRNKKRWRANQACDERNIVIWFVILSVVATRTWTDLIGERRFAETFTSNGRTERTTNAAIEGELVFSLRTFDIWN